jgi:DNA-directed RNA polymerase specialized sigma24 family protein
MSSPFERWARRISRPGRVDGLACDSSDYAQEFRLRAIERAPQHTEERLERWQYVVAKNAARSQIRRLKRIPTRVGYFDLPEQLRSVPAEAERVERCWFIGEILQRLPDQDGWILVLWAYCDLRIVDLWELLGRGSYSSVYRMVQRAVERAREIAVQLV